MNQLHHSLLSVAVSLFVVLSLSGCGEDPLQPIDTSDAEHSTPEDYAEYDREMIELSAGQTE